MQKLTSLLLDLANVLGRLYAPIPAVNTYRTEFRAVLITFSALGFHVGIWAVLLADLAGSLDLTPGDLGVGLSVMTASGVVALLVGGGLADRFGRRPFLLTGMGGTGVFFLLLASMNGSSSYAKLLAILTFGGVCASAWDLAANALGGDYERQYDVRVMTYLHAGFSGGAAAGALLGGMALWAGVHFHIFYAALGLALLILSGAFWNTSLPQNPSDPSREGRSEVSKALSASSLFFAPIVVACLLVVFLSFFIDAALESFLSIYLRDVLLSGPLLGGMGVAALYLAATVGRLFSGAVLNRVGERTVLTTCGLVAAFGIACVVLTGYPVVAAIALLVVGIATAPTAPIILSLTARSVPGASGRAISLVTVFGYAAFTLGPLLVGVIADLSSVRTALFVPIIFSLGLATVAGLLLPTSNASPGSE